MMWEQSPYSEVAQSCLTLCDPLDCSLTRLLCPWDSPGKNPRVGCHFLLQGIFLTQESNPSLQHCNADALPSELPGKPLHFYSNLINLGYNSIGFPGGSVVKNPPDKQETQEMRVWSLSQEDPLEEGMATHSSIFAWRIPMDRGAWQANSPLGPKESDMTEWLSSHAYTYYQVPNLNYKAYVIIKTYESLFLLCLSRCLFSFSGPHPLLNNTEARLQALWYHSMFLFIIPTPFYHVNSQFF